MTDTSVSSLSKVWNLKKGIRSTLYDIEHGWGVHTKINIKTRREKCITVVP